MKKVKEELKTMVKAIMRGNMREGEGVDDYLNRMAMEIMKVAKSGEKSNIDSDKKK